MNKAQHLKDPGSAITHFIGMVMAICGAIPLLIKAAREPGRVYLIFSCCLCDQPDFTVCCQYNISYI